MTEYNKTLTSFLLNHKMFYETLPKKISIFQKLEPLFNQTFKLFYTPIYLQTRQPKNFTNFFYEKMPYATILL